MEIKEIYGLTPNVTQMTPQRTRIAWQQAAIKVLLVVGILSVAIGCDRRSREDYLLCQAIEKGETNYLRAYLKTAGNQDRPVEFTSFGRIWAPPISLAVRSCQTVMIAELINHKADLNQPDWEGHTPLMWALGAAQTNRQWLMDLLLRNRADPNAAPNYASNTALHYAASYADPASCKLLLGRGANLGVTNRLGETPLHVASTVEIADLFIKEGADISSLTRAGETAADIARRKGHFRLLSLFTNASPASPRR